MTSLRQSVLRTRRVPRLGTLTASPDRATPSYRRFGNWVNSPLCLQNSMFVDPERRTLAVAWSFKYQSPPGANPELQDGIALRKPGPHHTALIPSRIDVSARLSVTTKSELTIGRRILRMISPWASRMSLLATTSFCASTPLTDTRISSICS